MKHRNRHGKWNRTVFLPVTVMALMIAMTIEGGRGQRAAAPVASFVVTNTNDSGPGSLRQAIVDSNETASADTITFSVSVPGTIMLSSALPTITGDLSIDGPGASSLTVSGNNSFRVFLIESGTDVAISNLTISNGKATGNFGGGIFNAGTLAPRLEFPSDGEQFSRRVPPFSKKAISASTAHAFRLFSLLSICSVTIIAGTKRRARWRRAEWSTFL